CPITTVLTTDYYAMDYW
nr:immunoglobulin heavy chain junction region [Mus musculus]